MPKTTYEATLPDGRVVTRGTARTYTHAVAIRATYSADAGRTQLAESGQWLVAGFAGSLELAEKEGRAIHNRAMKTGVVTSFEFVAVPARAR